MPRIAALEAPFPPEADALLKAMTPPGLQPIALFRTLARNLPMAQAMHTWGRYELSRHLSVGMREREIVIGRTCARCGCEYEWGVHIAYFAGRVGLTPSQIASLAHGGATDPCWRTNRDQLLIQMVDEFHADGDIGDELWNALAAEFADPQLIDLLALCGWYHAISFLARAMRLEPEPGAPRFADVGPDNATPVSPRPRAPRG
jgi:alkylhydroperoxidase family enzyme